MVLKLHSPITNREVCLAVMKTSVESWTKQQFLNCFYRVVFKNAFNKKKNNFLPILGFLPQVMCTMDCLRVIKMYLLSFNLFTNKFSLVERNSFKHLKNLQEIFFLKVQIYILSFPKQLLVVNLLLHLIFEKVGAPYKYVKSRILRIFKIYMFSFSKKAVLKGKEWFTEIEAASILCVDKGFVSLCHLLWSFTII